eukprot:1343889-Amorphochlora_amoeboformis.AAC.1
MKKEIYRSVERLAIQCTGRVTMSSRVRRYVHAVTRVTSYSSSRLQTKALQSEGLRISMFTSLSTTPLSTGT